ncbi:hypothetical protein [Gemmatimonas sp.]|uniref:hypothetical protein n=1 Tax=Gemmatimonas sp. TaxID=1962908 RepID=UPI00286E0429|nr:hypothetical protein [Gemmatimonas sp.]
MPFHRWVSVVLVAASVACSGEEVTNSGGAADALVVQSLARPASVTVASPFDVELTATNVTAAPITFTLSSGCAFAYEIRASDGRVVAAPTYACTAVLRSVTLSPGQVLRETYQYPAGEVGFPRLPIGTYRVVPTVNAGPIRGLVTRAADLTIR